MSNFEGRSGQTFKMANKQIKICQTTILKFKCIKGLTPNYLCDRINLLSDINIYNTQSSSTFNVQVLFPRKEFGKISFLCKGVFNFTSLPAFLEEFTDVTDF